MKIFNCYIYKPSNYFDYTIRQLYPNLTTTQYEKCYNYFVENENYYRCDPTLCLKNTCKGTHFYMRFSYVINDVFDKCGFVDIIFLDWINTVYPELSNEQKNKCLLYFMNNQDKYHCKPEDCAYSIKHKHGSMINSYIIIRDVIKNVIENDIE